MPKKKCARLLYPQISIFAYFEDVVEMSVFSKAKDFQIATTEFALVYISITCTRFKLDLNMKNNTLPKCKENLVHLA